MNGEGSDERETARTEAFSDGIFAFAITLLVLNLKDPVAEHIAQSGLLFQGLLDQFPSLFALITSFMTILIMWVNHHNMFSHIKRIDTNLMFLNGLLLFFVVITPFTTLLVANHVSFNQTPDGRTATAIYSGGFLLLALVWNTIWWYSSRTGLLARDDKEEHVRSVTLRYYFGPLAYGLAFGLSFLSGFASILVILIAAGYFTINATTARQRSSMDSSSLGKEIVRQ
jgi:uncharacterized membrane protein